MSSRKINPDISSGFMKYPPSGLRGAPQNGACSGLPFWRGEGLILSKVYYPPRRNLGHNALWPKRIFHGRFSAREICGLRRDLTNTQAGPSLAGHRKIGKDESRRAPMPSIKSEKFSLNLIAECLFACGEMIGESLSPFLENLNLAPISDLGVTE